MWSQTNALVFLFSVCRAATRSGSVVNSTSWIPSFNNLVAFGDSYTDESRLSYFSSHGGAAPPPGFLPPPSTTTSSGGITWARFVSINSGARLYNYGVSGAVCDNKIINRYVPSLNGPFPDVVYEVNAFLADTNYVDPSTHFPFFQDRNSNNTVYSIWIGTNDLGVGGFLTDSNLNGSSLTTFLDCIYEKFDRIYNSGGRYFVIMNLAPLQLSPLYGMPDTGGLVKSSYWGNKPENASEISGKMREYTRTVNELFEYRTPYELLVAKRYPGASIAIFDTNALITNIYNSPNSYLTQPANATTQYFKCDPRPFGNCTKQPEGLDHYLWYDELHPSEKTDEIIANEFSKVVQGTSKYTRYWLS